MKMGRVAGHVGDKLARVGSWDIAAAVPGSGIQHLCLEQSKFPCCDYYRHPEARSTSESFGEEKSGVGGLVDRICYGSGSSSAL